MSSTASRYRISSYEDTYRIYELTDEATDSHVLICPERGGIVIGCKLRGKELLYLDRATFLDPTANIRGGIPVLFPICGQLVGGEYEWEGVVYRMKNHGVARTSAWEVAAEDATGSAALTLVLRGNEATKAEYPFDFELRFTYRLEDGALRIEQSYRNLSEKDMPVHTGFHPYFATGDNKKIRYSSDATKLYDYNDGETKPYSGEADLSTLVESVALLDAQAPTISFPLGEGTVRLDYSPEFDKVVLWSVQGKPFVCVEPWTALNEALNRKEGLALLKPGEEWKLDLTISYS
ncbi:aldose epimerase family protein [Cohnella fermenti]|uniref:Aldose epimerase n=1 Tax=Cohnella fermenti TaxID=2565925 RepID=A0A4S4BSK8_9BACL|nr:aldose epimerase [Cohnella fermenti]THF78036.1 aldose epimerase [Cohnella fermenti]